MVTQARFCPSKSCNTKRTESNDKGSGQSQSPHRLHSIHGQLQLSPESGIVFTPSEPNLQTKLKSIKVPYSLLRQVAAASGPRKHFVQFEIAAAVPSSKAISDNNDTDTGRQE